MIHSFKRFAILFFLLALPFMNCGQTKNSSGPLFNKQVIFEASRSGYSGSRCPALVVTKKNSILIFFEARKGNGDDWDSMNLMMLRSIDGGKSWLEPIVIDSSSSGPVHNATPVADKNGAVHLLYIRDYKRCMYRQSIDDGITWSPPDDITSTFEAFKPEYDWKVIATGPGHGIQLTNGRLICAGWICQPDQRPVGGDHRPSANVTIFSDDHGKTWKRGSIIAGNNSKTVNPSETMLVELSDGRVQANFRNEGAQHQRLLSNSPDGINNWTEPKFSPDLFEPVCQASVLKLNPGQKSGRSVLLFCNPDSRGDPSYLYEPLGMRARHHLSSKITYDDGVTWVNNRVIEDGLAGYSDMGVDAAGIVYIVYEAGNKSGYETLKLVTASTGWLADSLTAPAIILDTDMGPDCDDAGALSMLHGLQDNGEARLLGVMCNTLSEWAPPCVDAINTYYGRPDVPIGTIKANGNTGDSKEWSGNSYNAYIAKHFPNDLKSSKNAIDATVLYRQLLANQPDKSVVIVSIGAVSNLRNVLLSAPDTLSRLSGEQLVGKKVKILVAMIGENPKGINESNLCMDYPASLEVLRRWPTKIIFSGKEVGEKVKTGPLLNTRLRKGNPVRVAYEMWDAHFRPLLSCNYLNNGQIMPHDSYDQTAVLFAARGAKSYWKLSSKGEMMIGANSLKTGKPVITNEWRSGKKRQDQFLIVADAVGLTKEIDELMSEPSSSK